MEDMTTDPTHAHSAPGPLPPLATLSVFGPAHAPAHAPVHAPAVVSANGWERAVGVVSRLAYALIALWLFLSAIAVMKTGAAALAPALQGSVLTDSLASTLGFGWLGAMLVMSGSPVAASALALLDGGAVDAGGAFMMLTGSRLGAAFVVLVVAFIYAMRGSRSKESRHASLSIGIFALLMTAVVYLPAMLIGVPLLGSNAMNALAAASPVELFNFVSTLTAPLVERIATTLPEQTLFFAGLVLLLVSIRMFDRALPHADESTLQDHADWRSRKWIMFGVGSLVALVTMSVSVALTILVPAVSKGYFRRRHCIPYIMGANITTLGDTLVTAMVIGNPDGVRVVLSELVGIVAITVVLLAFLYGPLTERLVQTTDWILTSRRRLACFVAVLFCVPISLIWFV